MTVGVMASAVHIVAGGGPVATPTARGNGFLDQFGSSARTDTSDSFTPAANALLVCVAVIDTQKSTSVGSSMSSTAGLGAGAFTKRVTIGPTVLTGGSGDVQHHRDLGRSSGGITISGDVLPCVDRTVEQHDPFLGVHGVRLGVRPQRGHFGGGDRHHHPDWANPVVTMSATPANTSLVLSACHTWNNGASAPITVPTSFTQFVDQVHTGWDSRTKHAYRNNGTNTATHQWTASGGGNNIAAALEIPVAP